MGLHERYARLLKDAPEVFMAGRKEREDEIRKQLSALFDGMMKAVYKTEGLSSLSISYQHLKSGNSSRAMRPLLTLLSRG